MTRLTILAPTILTLVLLEGCGTTISDPDLWPSDFVQKNDLPALVGRQEQDVLEKLGPPNYVVELTQTVSYLYEKYEDDTKFDAIFFVIPMPIPQDSIEASCVLLNFNDDGFLTSYKVRGSAGDCSKTLKINQYRHVDPRIYFAIEGDFRAIDLLKIYQKRSSATDHGRFPYLCLAADMGHPYAQIEVGRIFANGMNGLNKDIGRAYVWYSLAAKNTFDTHKDLIIKHMTSEQISEADQMLADWQPGQCGRDLHHIDNTDVDIIDNELSESHMRIYADSYCYAADYGIPDAQRRIGDLFYNIISKQEYDLVTAYVWYSLAARGNDSHAKVRLIKLESELSISHIDDAHQLLRKWEPGQCQTQVKDAIYKGLHYRHEKELERQRRKDLDLYCSNADMGHADAQAYIGDMHYLGAYSLDKNQIQAYVWYSLSAKNGNSYAAQQLQQLEINMPPSKLIDAKSKLELWEPGQCKQQLLKAPLLESE